MSGVLNIEHEIITGSIQVDSSSANSCTSYFLVQSKYFPVKKKPSLDKDHDLTQTRRSAIKMAVYGTTITTMGATTVSAQTTDRSKWVFEVDENIWGGPTVVDNTVFFGADNSILYAVDALTGERKWMFSTGGEIGSSSPAVVADTVFVGSKVGRLYAVGAETGEQQWSFEPTSRLEDARFNTSPTVVDGTVFAGNTDYNLYAIDADTGTLLHAQN